MTEFRIRRSTNEPDEADQLAAVTIDVVERGASVGFMLPLSVERATSFWRSCQAAVMRGERILLVAEDLTSNQVVGTVQVALNMPDNQPHRGEIAKMQVHSRAQRRGLGAALMRAAEAAAREAGKTLLVLDTVTNSAAHRLYSRLGWIPVGEIPDYALWPNGGYCPTTFFYKKLE